MSIKTLSAKDRAKLRQLLSEQVSNGAVSIVPEETAPSEKIHTELEKYRRAQQWIVEHRSEYMGQWVALDGDHLIGHGLNACELHLKAKAEGIEIPFVEQITEEPKFFYPGWE